MILREDEIGKRSDFDRVEKDFYRTIDTRAVDILQPFLVSIDGPEYGKFPIRYMEPCSGVGDLVNQLYAYGHECVYDEDISVFPFKNALDLTEADVPEYTNCIITNPPWSRPILHPMIEHFAKLKPTWLLFDADWAHTKQSSRYMKDYCTHIVSVGRLIWIEGTKTSGKDNCAWYRFDVNKEKDTIFYGR